MFSRKTLRNSATVLGLGAILLGQVSCGEKKTSNTLTDIEKLEELPPESQSAICPNPFTLNLENGHGLDASSLIDGQPGQFRLRQVSFHVLGLFPTGEKIAFQADTDIDSRDADGTPHDTQRIVCLDFTESAIYEGSMKLPDLIDRARGTLSLRKHDYSMTSNGGGKAISFPSGTPTLKEFLASLDSTSQNKRVRYRIYRRADGLYEVHFRRFEIDAHGNRLVTSVLAVYQRI